MTFYHKNMTFGTFYVLLVQKNIIYGRTYYDSDYICKENMLISYKI